MASELLRLIGRGAVAGAAAGVLSASVSWVLGEPSVERAIALEEAAARADGAGEQAEVFSRAAQLGGLVVVSILTGLAIGVLFGVVYAGWHRRDPDAEPWRRAIQLAVMGLVGVTLIPFLRYPGNPPAVGDPATAHTRTTYYLAAILIGIATVTAAAQLHHRLAQRAAAPSTRQLAVAGVVLIGLVATWLVPPNTDPIDVPAELIWNFRLASLATLVTLWASLGVVFGLLGQRAARRGPERARRFEVPHG